MVHAANICLDIICYAIAQTLSVCLEKLVKPFHRGFFCGDESISHPYKSSTVTNPMLQGVGIGLPIFTILAVEGFHVLHKLRQNAGQAKTGEKLLSSFTCRCSRIVISFLFGLSVTMLITSVGKCTIGRLRPHFLDVCRPDYARFNCSDHHGFPLYVEEDVCTGIDLTAIREARISFPSGHSSMSSYCMVFIMIFLHHRFSWRGSRLLCSFLQTIFLLLAFFTCLSRVSDYMHHWSDVLAGAILGVVMGCAMALRTDMVPMATKQRRGFCGEELVGLHRDDIEEGEMSNCMQSSIQKYGTFSREVSIG